MFQRIHQKLGTAGFVISIVALVAALGGGAYAASGALTQKQKKEVKKIAQTEAKKLATAGPQGSAGAPGAKGDTGSAGANGTNGTNGSNGQSVTGEPIAAGGACGSGVTGVKYTLGSSSTNVCNGKNGANGQTGFTETLPPEMTEKGSWAVGVTPPGTTFPLKTAISFPIPLAAAVPAANVHYVNEDQTAPAGCTGGTAAAPTAEPGHLCVYETFEAFLAFQAIFDPTSSMEAPGAGATGAILRFAGEEEAQAYGTWAVTAEAE